MIAAGNSRAKIVTGFTAMMFAVISAVMKRAVITTNHGAYPARGCGGAAGFRCFRRLRPIRSDLL
jgi:hypothetical protein